MTCRKFKLALTVNSSACRLGLLTF